LTAANFSFYRHEGNMSEDEIIAQLLQELHRAGDKHPPIRSIHELWGILDEEVEEFKDAVRSDDRALALEELVQIGAMAMRGLRDLPR
jgi:hypothetical protein